MCRLALQRLQERLLHLAKEPLARTPLRERDQLLRLLSSARLLIGELAVDRDERGPRSRGDVVLAGQQEQAHEHEPERESHGDPLSSMCLVAASGVQRWAYPTLTSSPPAVRGSRACASERRCRGRGRGTCGNRRRDRWCCPPRTRCRRAASPRPCPTGHPPRRRLPTR